jgi:hypothetical protein
LSNNKQEEPDYKAKIKKRAEPSSNLRYHAFEKADKDKKE